MACDGPRAGQGLPLLTARRSGPVASGAARGEQKTPFGLVAKRPSAGLGETVGARPGCIWIVLHDEASEA